LQWKRSTCPGFGFQFTVIVAFVFQVQGAMVTVNPLAHIAAAARNVPTFRTKHSGRRL
jgi:hypothetical protein